MRLLNEVYHMYRICCVGAYYVHGGEDAAQAVMNWLGCPVGVDPGIKAEARARVHGQLELLSKTKVSEVENLLNYRFENKGLLVEALTHASCRRAFGACYQVRASLYEYSIM